MSKKQTVLAPYMSTEEKVPPLVKAKKTEKVRVVWSAFRGHRSSDLAMRRKE
jgi:hypothetical protein